MSGTFLVAAGGGSRTFAGVLLTCQAGFESLLARELTELHGIAIAEKGPGWVLSSAALQPASGGLERGLKPALSPHSPDMGGTPMPPPTSRRPDNVGGGTGILPVGLKGGVSEGRKHRATADLTFAHLSLLSPVELRGDSVNALAARIEEFFLGRLRDERIAGAWPSVWLGPAELVGLGRRIGAVEAALGERLKRKLSRVAKLATSDLPRGVGLAPERGLFVFFADFGRVLVAREAWVHGQRRMADDDLAPSRSYLKVEEAYVVLGREPQPGETVCDLGAAPGGWSYSAAKRGARVLAIDNGPLKGGALDHPRIEHRREDAFRFAPAPGGAAFDWLFCDLVEEPHHVLQHLVAPWLARGWCRRFVVNLKLGRVDPIALLRELRAPDAPLATQAPGTCIRHLYHDREELTLVGGVVRGSRAGG